MIPAASLLCIVASVGLAVAALRHPHRAATLETGSGLCLVAGLVLLGAGLRLAQ